MGQSSEATTDEYVAAEAAYNGIFHAQGEPLHNPLTPEQQAIVRAYVGATEAYIEDLRQNGHEAPGGLDFAVEQARLMLTES